MHALRSTLHYCDKTPCWQCNKSEKIIAKVEQLVVTYAGKQIAEAVASMAKPKSDDQMRKALRNITRSRVHHRGVVGKVWHHLTDEQIDAVLDLFTTEKKKWADGYEQGFNAGHDHVTNEMLYHFGSDRKTIRYSDMPKFRRKV